MSLTQQRLIRHFGVKIVRLVARDTPVSVDSRYVYDFDRGPNLGIDLRQKIK